MNKTTIVAVIALVIAIIGLFTPAGQVAKGVFGGVTNYDEVDATAIKIGTSGSRLGQITASTCNLIGTDGSQAASSTAAYDCAISGIVSGDTVFAVLNRATAFGTNIGWHIEATRASTTAGYATVILGNWSGVAAVPSFTGVGSSTQYFTSHPVTSVPGL